MTCLTVAHRGFSALYPENTMISFQKAYEAGADGIELDVQLAKDGQVVIMHDTKIDRTTDGKGRLAQFSVPELRRFNAAHLYTGKVGRQSIPTLKEYLEWARNKPLFTNIELKTDEIQYEDIEQKVLRLLDEYNMGDKVILSSFHFQTIRNVKEINSRQKCGLLSVHCDSVLLSESLEIGTEYVHPHYSSVTGEMVNIFRQHQIQINTWTVDKDFQMERLQKFGVHAIITNSPDKLNQLLHNKQKGISVY